MLGPRSVADNGRKVAQTRVKAWQWTKIKLAALLLAVDLHRNPDLLTAPQFDAIKGPEFEMSGRKGSANPISSRVRSIVAGTGLVVTSARMR